MSNSVLYENKRFVIEVKQAAKNVDGYDKTTYHITNKETGVLEAEVTVLLQALQIAKSLNDQLDKWFETEALEDLEKERQDAISEGGEVLPADIPEPVCD